MKKRASLSMEGFIASLLTVAGRLSGEQILAHVMGTIVEFPQAVHEVRRVAESISRMANDGHIECEIEDGQHLWSLTEEAKSVWATEYLNEPPSETH